MSLVTSAVVLAFTIVALFSYQVFALSTMTVRQLHTLSETIATNSAAALAFDDAAGARRVLQALRAEPHIVAAALYNRRGRLFAWYPAHPAGGALPVGPPGNGYRLAHGYLVGVSPVAQGSERLGTLYVQSNLAAIYRSMELYGVIAALVIALGVAAAYVTANRLQRHLSAPILRLAAVAKAASDRQDYNTRASPAGTQELDHLTEAFNYMLGQVQRGERGLLTQVSRLSLLWHITRVVADRLDLRSIFETVLHSLEEHLPIDFGCVCLCSPGDDSLAVSAVGPASRERARAMGLDEATVEPVGDSELAACVRGQLVYESDATRSDSPLLRRLAAGGVSSLVLAPLAVERRVFGVLVVARRSAEAFGEADCEFLKQLSEHVALASHQAQLHSALRQAYEDLRQSQHTVMQQERLRALGQMASGIAHDINNALSPVSIYTDILLQHESGLSARARELLATIRKATQDVAGTVARMREFYRQREPQLTLALIDANRIVSEAIELTRPRWFHELQQRGVDVDLKTELAAAAPHFLGAEVEIRDALTNLIFNAVDAMPKGGTLTLRTRCSGDGEEGHRAIVEVCDTGVGMDEATRRRCLEPFFTTKGERGTGLGLAIVYGTVQRHNAAIEIDSAEGQGTTVRLKFLANAQAPSSPTTASAAAPAPGRRLRILLVDDDPMLIQALRDALEQDGHIVTAAHGGQAGIDAFAATRRAGSEFAVVLTDLGMPHVDGRRVAAAIKSMSPHTPIILLTGWGERLLAENDVPPEVDRMLHKPPRLHELRAALAALA